VQTETVFSGMAATIAVPDAAGVYLLQITDMAGAQRVLKKILVY
jgi:hypothetical protein